MKKFTILSLAAVCAFSASAQMSVVKEAERAMKGDKSLQEVVTIITPAFTNEETQNLAQTYYVPGNTAFQEYDHLLGLKQFNKLPADGDRKMSLLLIDGYNYFQTAFQKDSLPNEKGKIKPKYSKKMLDKLAGHFGDYSNAGATLWGTKDYDKAYQAWLIFDSFRTNPDLAKELKKGGKLPADTIFGELAYNRALAAWQGEKLEDALSSFQTALQLGYKKKDLFTYAISVATGLKNQEEVLRYAEAALPLYGQEDPMFISQVVNYYLQNKDFTKAHAIIDDAIALQPNNAQYYVIKGVLYENAEDRANAKASYEKAMQLDAQNAQAVFNFGRMICEEAYRIADGAPTDQKKYTAYFNEKVKPLFIQAAEVLENAYNLNPDNEEVLKYLDNIYYNLNDEAKLNDVKKRKSY